MKFQEWFVSSADVLRDICPAPLFGLHRSTRRIRWSIRTTSAVGVEVLLKDKLLTSALRPMAQCRAKVFEYKRIRGRRTGVVRDNPTVGLVDHHTMRFRQISYTCLIYRASLARKRRE